MHYSSMQNLNLNNSVSGLLQFPIIHQLPRFIRYISWENTMEICHLWPLSISSFMGSWFFCKADPKNLFLKETKCVWDAPGLLGGGMQVPGGEFIVTGRSKVMVKYNVNRFPMWLSNKYKRNSCQRLYSLETSGEPVRWQAWFRREFEK